MRCKVEYKDSCSPATITTTPSYADIGLHHHIFQSVSFTTSGKLHLAYSDDSGPLHHLDARKLPSPPHTLRRQCLFCLGGLNMRRRFRPLRQHSKRHPHALIRCTEELVLQEKWTFHCLIIRMGIWGVVIIPITNAATALT